MQALVMSSIAVVSGTGFDKRRDPSEMDRFALAMVQNSNALLFLADHITQLPCCDGYLKAMWEAAK